MTSEAEQRMAYVILEPCGCVTAATVDITDDPKRSKSDIRAMRAEIRRWLKGGHHVVHMPSEEVRKRLVLDWPGGCPHGKEDQSQFEVVTEVPE